MSDSFEFTLHTPLTKEDWNEISDAEHENTLYVTFQTPQGGQVKYIKCDVLDKIRDEIEQKIKKSSGLNHTRTERDRNNAFLEVVDIIDKYRAERMGG